MARACPIARKHELHKVIVSLTAVFPFEIDVVIGPFAGYLCYVREKYRCEDSDAEEPRGRCIQPHNAPPVIWLPKVPATPAEFGTLAHEAYHATVNFMEYTGIPMTRDTEEVAAHVVGTIVRTVLAEAKGKR